LEESETTLDLISRVARYEKIYDDVVPITHQELAGSHRFELLQECRTAVLHLETVIGRNDAVKPADDTESKVPADSENTNHED